MGGKGGGGGGPSLDQITQQAYQAGQQGLRWNDIQGRIPYGHDSALQSWMAGQRGGGGGFEMPSFEMPSFEMPMPDYEAQQALYEQQLADAEQRQREAEQRALRTAGLNERDQRYSAYLDAADTATNYVNSEIARERANARLLGLDYDIDDEIKTTRISDYFATIWGEGEQQRLDALIKQWGAPQGFEGYAIVRGDGSTYGDTTSSETPVDVSRGMQPRPPLLEESEEDTLATAGALGV